MLPISDLALAGDRIVVFYDQLGNAKSTHLPDKPKEFWNIDLFIDELESLAAYLGFENYDVLGHSWGGIMVNEFLVRRRPKRIGRYVCSNSPASIPLYLEHIQHLLDGFPPWVKEAYNDSKSERNGEASDLFNARHTIRVQPWPEEYNKSMASIKPPKGDPTVVKTMWWVFKV
jgi:pimeloyl-ACP methyl ester carboxylesterase